MTKMNPKTGLFWCAVTFVFSLITFYYGGLDAIESSVLSLTAIALTFMYLNDLKKRKGKVK
jgi:hypothetical protein